MEEASPVELILAHQARLDAINGGSEPEPRNALEYLQDVYKGRRPPDAWRMRAAMAALPFETPKLSATALSFPGDFAQTLERAILRSGVKMPRTIDAEALPQPE